MNISFRITSTVFLILLFINPSLFAQEAVHTCGFNDETAHESTDFEDNNDKHYWQNVIAPTLSQSKVLSDDDAIHIPVVVHVVHEGEPYGVGRNVEYKRIEAQIDELNKAMMGWDGNESIVPERWLDLVDYPKLKFFLADTDPNGQPTNGVTRDSLHVVNPQTGHMNTSAIKSALYWNTNHYLNIYVLSIQGTSEEGGLVGFSSFPSSVGTSGDGFVIDYRWFGGPGFGQVGFKTTTHEAGHYFGLYHTFAGNACNLDDGLADTPNVSQNTNSVATFTCDDGYPVGPTTCTDEHLYPNHMDYSHRSCKTMFTQDQSALMRSVVDGTAGTNNWPSRENLANYFDTAVHLNTNDAGLCRLVYPQEIYCGQNTVSPIIELKNYGTENLTHLWINISNNQGYQESIEWLGDLCLAQKALVQLNPIDIPYGDVEWTFEVSYFDNTTDEKLSNNTLITSTTRPEMLPFPIVENFEVTNGSFLFGNQLDLPSTPGEAWEINTIASANEQGNQSIYFQNKLSPTIGTTDTLFSKNLDFNGQSNAHLCFKTAYRSDDIVGDLIGDSLAILVGYGCEEFVYEEVWKMGGQDLASAISNNSSPFIPTAPNWQQWSINLTGYDGTQAVRIAFVNYSYQSESLYLDDIKIKTSDNCGNELDASILEIISPSPYGCSDDFTDAIVQLKNEGELSLTEVVFHVYIDNQLIGTQTWNGQLHPTESTTVYLPSFATPAAGYEIKIIAANPNQSTDENLSNNIAIQEIFETTAQPALLQENFEDVESNQFTSLNPTLFGGWLSNSFVSAYGIGNTCISVQENTDSHWLISENFEYSMIQNATLTFDYAHAYADNGGAMDSLFILASTDCGASYDHTLFQKSSSQLSTFSLPNTLPSSTNWQTELIDLSAFDNMSNLRLAFVYKANTPNTFYLDNVNLNTNCAITVLPIITHDPCEDSCDGAVDFEVYGNIGDVSYNFSSLPNGSPTDLCQGSYQVTIVDEANCAWVENVQIEAPAALALDIATAGFDCATQETIFELQPSGGIGNYTYQWNDFIETPSQLSSGTYLVTISDGASCNKATSITIAPTIPLSLTASIINETSFQSLDGSIYLDVQGGFGDYEYEWNFGSGNETATNLSPSNYSVTVTDEHGCEVTQNFDIEPYNCAYFQPSLSSQHLLCFNDNNGSIEVVNQGGLMPLTFNWSNQSNEPNIESLPADLYTVTVSDNANCEQVLSSFVMQPPALSLDTEGTLETAFELNNAIAVALGVGGTPFDDGSYTYLWNNGFMTNSIINLSPDIYLVTVTDANGCQAIDSILINPFNCPTEVASQITDISCNEDQNGQIVIDSSAFTQPIQIDWSIPGNEFVQSNLAGGIYDVSILDASNCAWYQSLEVAVADIEPPVIVATDITLSLDISGTAILNPDLVAIGSFDNCQLNSLTTDFVNFNCSHLGSNTLTLIGEDGNNNTALEEFIVTVIDEIAPSINCPETVLIENCNGLISYELPEMQDNCQSPNLTLLSGPSNGDILDNGTYTATFQAMDASGNSNTCSFDITVIKDALELDTVISPESCEGAGDGAVLINDITGPHAPYDFVNELSDLNAGSTSINISGSDGCSVDWPIEIPQIPAISLEILTISPTTNGANNGAIQTLTTGGTTPYFYEWFLDGELITFDANPVAIGSGSYTCQITDANDCVFVSEEVIVDNINGTKELELSNINIYPNPTQDFLLISMNNEPVELSSLRLFNAIGQRISLDESKTSSTTSALQLDVQDLTHGAYFLEFTQEGQIYFQKFIKL